MVDTPFGVSGTALFTLDGRIVASVGMSGILRRHGIASGIYLLQVIDRQGHSHTPKILLR